MNANSETEIERVALNISPKARLRLAAKLLASVPGSAHSAINEDEALDLAQQRAAEFDSGKVDRLDYREEMDRIRASLSG